VRTATLGRQPRGPSPLPRRRINQPAFYEAVRGCGRPGYQVAYDVGLIPVELSKLICAESVPDTPLQVERLERIADFIGFDRDRLFLNGGQ
jgi:hypothetical protein